MDTFNHLPDASTRYPAQFRVADRRGGSLHRCDCLLAGPRAWPRKVADQSGLPPPRKIKSPCSHIEPHVIQGPKRWAAHPSRTNIARAVTASSRRRSHERGSLGSIRRLIRTWCGCRGGHCNSYHVPHFVAFHKPHITCSTAGRNRCRTAPRTCRRAGCRRSAPIRCLLAMEPVIRRRTPRCRAGSHR
jgi:hypothetical protein